LKRDERATRRSNLSYTGFIITVVRTTVSYAPYFDIWIFHHHVLRLESKEEVDPISDCGQAEWQLAVAAWELLLRAIAERGRRKVPLKQFVSKRIGMIRSRDVRAIGGQDEVLPRDGNWSY
jgi:hypothetical protein